jgi:RNA polymerase sigma-70 factor (ECF subfamily)
MHPMITPLSAELRQAERRELDLADIGVDHPGDASARPSEYQETRGLLLGGPAAECPGMHSVVEQAFAAVKREAPAPCAPDDGVGAMAAQVIVPGRVLLRESMERAGPAWSSHSLRDTRRRRRRRLRIRGAQTSPEVEDESGSAAPRASLARAEETRLVEALRAGDEEAFVRLVRLHEPTMLRVARLYTSSRAIAEEVVQETWLGVLTGIGRFEGRSSFRTWLFRILVNKAKTRAVAERRSVSFAALSEAEVGAPELSVEADRFRAAGERWAHHWTSSPERWAELPEVSLLSQETIATVEQAAALLPAAQRAVVILRDVVGCDAHEVCDIVGTTATNQRVLLHRARTKVRSALEQRLASSQP